jgi:hypothetical protein
MPLSRLPPADARFRRGPSENFCDWIGWCYGRDHDVVLVRGDGLIRAGWLGLIRLEAVDVLAKRVTYRCPLGFFGRARRQVDFAVLRNGSGVEM